MPRRSRKKVIRVLDTEPLSLRKAVNKQITRRVNRMSETKSFLERSDGSTTGSDFVPLDLTDGLSAGTGSHARIGDRVKIQSSTFRFWAREDNNTDHLMRIIIFQWKQDSSAVSPVIGNILEDTTTVTAAMLSDYDFDQRQKYKILYDRLLVMPGAATTGGSPHEHYWKKVIKGKNILEMIYNVGADTGTNHMYIVALADATLASGTTPLLGYVVQHKFKDF